MNRSGDVVLVRVRVRGVSGADREARAELAAAALWEEGATGLEVREDPEGTTLLAGYPTAAAARVVAAHLRPVIGAEAEAVTDGSWRDAWRDWIQPVAVGGRLRVVPAWRRVPLASGRIDIEIDPGDCFGSGTHASTRMILAWLDAHPPVGAGVVDVGTGSGILAVAAARLGAQKVTAVDIDPDATAVTAANAERNGVASTVAASATPVDRLEGGSADLVLVNVTAGVHATIGPDCARALRPGGTLVLAGLLPGQWAHVAGAYAPLAGEELLSLDGWEGAVLRRALPA